MTLKEMRQSQVQIKYESQLEKRRSQRRTQGFVLTRNSHKNGCVVPHSSAGG